MVGFGLLLLLLRVLLDVVGLGMLLLLGLLLLLRGLLGVVGLVLLRTRRLVLLLMLLRGWCAASAHGLWLEPLLLLLLLLLLLGTQHLIGEGCDTV